jgi:hypothetical protein
MSIVGVLSNLRDAGGFGPGLNALCAPLGQFDVTHRTMSLVLRTAVEPESLTQAVRREVSRWSRTRPPGRGCFPGC